MRVRGAAALALAALLPLAGCGGSSGGGAAVRPSGQAVPNAPGDVAAKSEFPLPADMQLAFESPRPADRKRADIIAGFEYVYRGFYYSLHTKGKDRRFFKRMEHEALFLFSKTFDGAVKNHLSNTGRLRFFNTRVSAVNGDRGAAVDSCIDQTQWRVKDLRTGETGPAARKAGLRRYKVVVAMRRGDDGLWRMFDLTTYHPPDTRAKECQQ